MYKCIEIIFKNTCSPMIVNEEIRIFVTFKIKNSILLLNLESNTKSGLEEPKTFSKKFK